MDINNLESQAVSGFRYKMLKTRCNVTTKIGGNCLSLYNLQLFGSVPLCT